MKLLLPFVLMSVTACHGEVVQTASDSAPADAADAAVLAVAGGWSGSSTNDSTTCPGSFDIGAVTTSHVVITQAGVDLTIKIDGLAAIGFQEMFGLDTLTGTLAGDKITVKVVGIKEQTEAATCKYKWKGVLEGTIKGTTMSGTTIYTPVVISGGCTTKFLECSRVQSFTTKRDPG